MCVRVAFGGQIYGSPRKLSEILPNGYVEDRRFTYPEGSDVDPDSCLCQLDIDATAERNGFGMEWSSAGNLILVFTRREPCAP